MAEPVSAVWLVQMDAYARELVLLDLWCRFLNFLYSALGVEVHFDVEG